MERGAFSLLSMMERSWWYRGRASAVEAALMRSSADRVLTVLDFGAGFGGMRYQLSRFGIDIYACEPDQEARDAARARGYVNVFPSEEDAFRRTWDMIGLFDVVEHIADDRAFFARAYDALSAHGRLAVTVPAFPFLWSSHDVSHHHFRRYTKAVMRQRLEAAGFQIEYESYWNMLLFFPAALMRLLGRSGESTLSLPRWLDGFFFAIVAMETKWMRLGSLPFGTGLVVIARKRSYSANDVV